MSQRRAPTPNEPDKEAEFFDKVYEKVDHVHKGVAYIVPDEIVREITRPATPPLSPREFASSLMGNLNAKRLLDYGAGDGWNSVCFAKAGAKVWAIDISKKGIELTLKKVHANGVADQVTAEVRDCYNTRFESGFFYVIYGGGILHHLDIEAAGREIARILRPDGVAVFTEPMRESRILDIIKSVVLKVTRRKPAETTTTESPLTWERIDPLRRFFGVVRSRQFEVLSSAALLIRSPSVKRFLLWADHLLIRLIPGFKKLARLVVIELRDPYGS